MEYSREYSIIYGHMLKDYTAGRVSLLQREHLIPPPPPSPPCKLVIEIKTCRTVTFDRKVVLHHNVLLSCTESTIGSKGIRVRVIGLAMWLAPEYETVTS